MTGPLGGGELGDAYISVHANTEPFVKDLDKDLEKAGAKVNPTATKVGKDIGGKIGDGAEKEVARRGPGIARELASAVEHEALDIAPNWRYNVRGKNGRFVRQAASGIASEVEDAFSAAANSGIFAKLGQAVADAIGSGFNVSGKSPLVYILAPVYAAIAGLVIAAIQAANGVIAALLAIPAAISVVAVEVGVLFLAFNGLGAAIQGAFAAKNVDELNAALKNLTPSAQSFVKALLPAKSLFDTLAKSAQENFFVAFGGGTQIKKLLDAISGPLKQNIPVVAQALGRFFAQLTAFFSSPLFIQFINKIFPAVAMIIDTLGGPFIQLLLGTFILINQSLPFLLELTARFGDLLRNIGDALASVSPDWLDHMLETLDSTFDLVGQVIKLVAVLLSQLDAAGGKGLIDFITQAVGVLANFLATDVGKEAIAGLIRIGEIGIFITLSFIEALLLLAAAFQLITNTIGTFFNWLVDTALPAIGHFFSWLTQDSSAAFTAIGTHIQTALANFQTFLVQGVARFVDTVQTRFGDVVTFVKGIPGKITAAIGNLGTLLLSAGRNLISGLIQGIKDSLPGLGSFLSGVGAFIAAHKGPEEKDLKLLVPAGKDIMTGLQAGMAAGAGDIKTFLDDFTTDLGGVGVNQNSTHILFGANAFQLNFQGALPTASQAMAIGQAVGTGVNSQLAARDTRLAVRTL